MKHIKLYEEYSDDELKNLLGDLESAGHKHRLIPGEDFGFGKDMKEENDGDQILFLSQEAKDQITRALERDFNVDAFFNHAPYSTMNPFPGWAGIKGVSTKWFTHPIMGQILKRDDLAYVPSINRESFPPYFLNVKSHNREFPAASSKSKPLAKLRVQELYSKLIPYIEKITF
jgi:hypothetical protein